MADDEAQLITDSQRGDARAFNLLVERYQTRLYNLSLRMLNDPDAAADTTQDAFLSAFRSIKRFRGGSFAAWLSRIATNACYDQLRARQRRPTTSIDALIGDDEEHAPQQFPSADETPDDRSLRNELADEIQRGLQALDTDYRLAVILSDIQGYSYDDISAITGWPLGTVKSRLSRGRAALRDTLRQGELLPARYRQAYEDL